MAEFWTSFSLSEMISTFYNHLLLQSLYGLIIMAVILLFTRYVLRGRFPYFQYCLWALLFLRFILPPDFSTAFSARAFLEDTPLIAYLWGDEVTQQQTFFHDFLPLAEGLGFSSATTTSKNTAEISSLSFWQISMLLFWLLGIGVSAFLFLRKIGYYHRLIRQSTPVTAPELLAIITHWRSHFSIKKRVLLVTDRSCPAPFTMGVLRPVIFIPQELISSQKQARVSAIVAHEMAHIKRFDQLWIRCQNLLQIIYFFHPAVWIASRYMNQSREQICDRLVLSSGSVSPRDYGRSMLDVLKMTSMEANTYPVFAGFSNNNLSHFTTRLKTLKKESIMKKQRICLPILLTILLGLLILPLAPKHFNTSTAAASLSDTTPTNTLAVTAPLVTSFGDDTASPTPSMTAANLHALTFTAPIKSGRITSHYGMRKNPTTKKKQLHKGIDIAAPIGTDVFSAADGTITIAETSDSNHGKRISVQHSDGYTTHYSHLSKIDVQAGDKVAAGEVIGAVGNTGVSTAPHLHFEVYQNDQLLDPRDVIDFSFLKSGKK